MRTPGLAASVVFAALSGAAAEGVVIAARIAGAAPLVDRVGRLERVLLVAGFVGLVAIGVGLLVRFLMDRRRAGPPRAPVAALVGGLLAWVWLAMGFLVAPPDPADILVTTDPVVARLPMIGAATLLVAVAAWPLTALLSRPSATAIAVGTTLAALAGTAAALLPGDPARTPDAPDLFLVSIDTLRADHLGCYGYARPTSPAIDRLCDEAVVFDRAMSVAPQTIPSFSSLMTGLLPVEHGVYNNLSKMDLALETLPERLAERGYRTAAIVMGAFPGSFANLDQGVDVLIQRGVTASSPMYTLHDALWSLLSMPVAAIADALVLDASVTSRTAVHWVSHLARSRPVFVHVYWNYPHGPYDPPEAHLRQLPEPDASSTRESTATTPRSASPTPRSGGSSRRSSNAPGAATRGSSSPPTTARSSVAMSRRWGVRSSVTAWSCTTAA